MWTKKDKEWQGYKRKMSVQDKSSITLAKAPWEKELSSKLEVRSIIKGASSLLTPKVNVS